MFLVVAFNGGAWNLCLYDGRWNLEHSGDINFYSSVWCHPVIIWWPAFAGFRSCWTNCDYVQLYVQLQQRKARVGDQALSSLDGLVRKSLSFLIFRFSMSSENWLWWLVWFTYVAGFVSGHHYCWFFFQFSMRVTSYPDLLGLLESFSACWFQCSSCKRPSRFAIKLLNKKTKQSFESSALALTLVNAYWQGVISEFSIPKDESPDKEEFRFEWLYTNGLLAVIFSFGLLFTALKSRRARSWWYGSGNEMLFLFCDLIILTKITVPKLASV